MSQPSVHLKLLTAFTFIYGGLLIYASLMPYDFISGVDINQLLHSQIWKHWPFNLHGRISGSDFVSNLLLYIPLGFLLATRWRFTDLERSIIFALTILFCSGLSIGIEILQGLMISRVPSATDWLLNSISGALGATLGVTQGRPLWEQTINWLQRRWQSHPLDILTLVFLGLLTADALTPFLPTLLLSQVWRNLKHSHFNLIEGLAQHPWHWWLMNHVLLYMILMLLLAEWGEPNRRARNKWYPSLLALGVALALEAVKPMIVSRTINLSNIATAAAGAGLAASLEPLWAERVSLNRKLELALLALLGYGFYLSWSPFNFVWDPELVRRRIPSLRELLPLYHYAMGATLNHIRLFVQGIALKAILIYLLRVRFSWLQRCRFQLILAIVFTGALGLLQEGGQMFLPTRMPSMTDVYCCMIGGALGVWAPLFYISREESST